MKTQIYVLIFILAAGSTKLALSQTNSRFIAPKINQQHSDFLKRNNRNLINIDFIIANALGETKSAINDGEQAAQNGANQDITGSVVVQPGADADNVTIININEGDVTAITR